MEENKSNWQKWQPKVIDLLWQIVPVTIGVYLGFLVSSWSDDNKSKQQSRALIENIKVEVRANKGKIEQVIDYHTMLRDSSRIYGEPNSDQVNPNFFKGIQMQTLNTSAYETGIQTGIINELSIDQIQELHQLYSYQEFYNEMGKMILSSLINKDFSDNIESMRKITQFLLITMTDVVIQEGNLVQKYEGLLEELE